MVWLRNSHPSAIGSSEGLYVYRSGTLEAHFGHVRSFINRDLGIGTNDPKAKLDVNGESIVRGSDSQPYALRAITSESSTAADFYIAFDTSTGVNRTRIGYLSSSDNVFSLKSVDGDIELDPNGDVKLVSNNLRLFNNSEGNYGISTESQNNSQFGFLSRYTSHKVYDNYFNDAANSSQLITGVYQESNATNFNYVGFTDTLNFYPISYDEFNLGSNFSHPQNNSGSSYTPSLSFQSGGEVHINSKTESMSGFSSGFNQSGTQIDFTNDYIETDSLTVRGRMSIYELLINQIRATNGSL